MAEEIGFENGRNSNFQGLVTLTLTLDPAIRHTLVHHSSTCTYIPNFIQIEETFCGRTDGRTFFPSNIIRSTFGSRPKKSNGRQCKRHTARVNWQQVSDREFSSKECMLSSFRHCQSLTWTRNHGNLQLHHAHGNDAVSLSFQ